jgi:hypothetical protein
MLRGTPRRAIIALLSAEVHLLLPLRSSLSPIMASLSLSVPSAPRPTPWWSSPSSRSASWAAPATALVATPVRTTKSGASMHALCLFFDAKRSPATLFELHRFLCSCAPG